MKPRDKEKKREYDRKYREKNKERLNEQRKIYYQENKEKIAAKNKRYRERNKEKVAEGKRKQYREYRMQWVAYLGRLVALECNSCGYNKTFAALDFHHTRDKVFHITSMMMKALTKQNKETMKKEVEKCIVLCANCHRELHDRDTGDYLERKQEFGV